MVLPGARNWIISYASNTHNTIGHDNNQPIYFKLCQRFNIYVSILISSPMLTIPFIFYTCVYISTFNINKRTSAWDNGCNIIRFMEFSFLKAFSFSYVRTDFLPSSIFLTSLETFPRIDSTQVTSYIPVYRIYFP